MQNNISTLPYTKYLTTADIHIHDYVRNNKDGFRLKQFIALAHRLVEIGKQNEVKALVIAGDFTEYAVHNPNVAHAISQFLEIVCAGFEWVGYVLGNHDFNTKLDSGHFSNSVIPLLFPENKGHYMHEKVVTLPNGRTVAFTNWLPEQEWKFFEGQVDVLFGHMCISSMFGQSYDPSRYKLGIFGDIHQPNEFDNGKTWTVNVPIPSKLGDCQNGSVLLVDTDEMKCTRILTESENFKYMKMYYEDSVPEADKDNPYLFKIKRASKEDQTAKMHINVKSELNVDSVIDNAVLAGGFTKIHQEVKTKFLNESDCTPLDFNFELISIEIENFRSIKHFDYDFQSGLLWVNGEIGSGKSSMLRAINYVLTNNEEPRDCLKEGEKSLRVDLALRYQDRIHRIQRSWSGGQTLNYWIDGVQQAATSIKERSKQINDNLPWISRFNLLYRSQMNPGLLSQFGFNDRINLISDILGLSTISAYLDASKRYMDSKFRELKVTQDEIQVCQQVLDSHKDFHQDRLTELRSYDLESAAKEFNETKQKANVKLELIKDKEAKHREIQRLQSNLGEEVTCNITEQDNVNNQQWLNQGKQVLLETEKELSKVESDLAGAKRSLNNAEESLRSIRLKESCLKDNCPTCGTTLDVESNNTARENFKWEIQDIEKRKSQHEEEIIVYEQKQNELRSTISEIKSGIRDLEVAVKEYGDYLIKSKAYTDNLNHLNKLVAEYNLDQTDVSEKESLLNQITQADSNLQQTAQLKGELIQLERTEKFIEENKTKVESLKNSIYELEIDAELSRKYYSLFTNTGEVTSKVFEAVANILTDDNLKVTTVRQLASGETRIDFDVEFKVDNIWIKYNNLSGGQMGLADLFFLSKLLKMSNGAGVLILDEALAHISSTMMETAIEEIQTIPANLIIFVTHVASFPHYQCKIDAYREANTTRYVVN